MSTAQIVYLVFHYVSLGFMFVANETEFHIWSSFVILVRLYVYAGIAQTNKRKSPQINLLLFLGWGRNNSSQ